IAGYVQSLINATVGWYEMHSYTRAVMVVGTLFLAGWACAFAQAQTPLNEVQLVSSSAVAAGQTPQTQTFTITTAGSYDVTLSDLSPAPLASLQLAIATADATVLQMSAAGTNKTSSVTLQPGTY